MTLFNGDCYELVPNILQENSNVCIVTDPPFNINYHYNGFRDKIDHNLYIKRLSNLFCMCPSVVIHYPETLYELALNMGKVPKKVVSWVYNSNLSKQHRDIAFFDIVPNFKQVIQPYKNPNDKRIKERIARGILGGKLYDWWNINQVKNVSKAKTNHPCQMPLEIMKNIVGILPKDTIILDPFMGSGTTGIACKLLGKDFIGIELVKKYYDIAVSRLEEV